MTPVSGKPAAPKYMVKMRMEKFTAYCPGCHMNTIRGRPGDTFVCATGGRVKLVHPRPDAYNAEVDS